MTYWTVMFITILSGPMEGQQMPLLYKSEALCIEATKQVSDSLSASYDHKIECVPSDTPSKSKRPKKRKA